MPASTLLFDEHHRLQLGNRLRGGLEQTRTRARRAAEARRTSQQLDQQKNQLVAANPNLANVDVHRRTIYNWLFVCIVAVYLIDVVLFAAVAEYFAKQSFAGSPFLVSLTRFLIPAVIVAIELGLSIHRDAAYREYLEGLGSRGRFWAWTALAVFCTVVMPMAVIAIFVAGEGSDFSASTSVPLLITLAGLSLVCHVIMLFGGRLAMESKAYQSFRLQQNSLQNRIRQGNRVYATHSQAAADRFAVYLQDLNAYNPAFPTARIEPGPFDKDTREIVNDVYGYEVIRTPAGGPAPQAQVNQPVPPPPNPPNPGPQQTEENNPDWRTAYERQMREQEAEVRP